jgi:hypothetical protein
VITDVWPEATAAPQAFVTVSNRAEAFSTHINQSLAEGNAGTAARLLDEFAGDLANAAGGVTAYRTKLVEPVFGGAMLPSAALTLGPASIFAVRLGFADVHLRFLSLACLERSRELLSARRARSSIPPVVISITAECSPCTEYAI